MMDSNHLKMNVDYERNTPSLLVDPSTQSENFNGTISIYSRLYFSEGLDFMVPEPCQDWISDHTFSANLMAVVEEQ